jgi:hypothetical protein
MLTNIQDALADSNFCNNNRKAIQLQIAVDLNVTWAMWIRETE